MHTLGKNQALIQLNSREALHLHFLNLLIPIMFHFLKNVLILLNVSGRFLR